MAGPRSPPQPASEPWLAGLPAVRGNYRAGEQALRGLVEDPESSQRMIARAGLHLVGVLMVQGWLEEAVEGRPPAFGPRPLGDDFVELQHRIWTSHQHHERILASQSTERLRDEEWEVPLIHIRLARLEATRS